jgi:hypothetical protein
LPNGGVEYGMVEFRGTLIEAPARTAAGEGEIGLPSGGVEYGLVEAVAPWPRFGRVVTRALAIRRPLRAQDGLRQRP